MRIIAGRWKGMPLRGPENSLTRPTSDRLREAIFNILNSYLMKENLSFDALRVLDCFAGTGALGLEALSRGAQSVTFIEKSTEACRSIRTNIDDLKAQTQCHIIQSDVLNLRISSVSYHLIFLDPPYGQALCEKALENLLNQQWLADHAVVVVESGASESLTFSDGFQLLSDRRVGSARVWILVVNRKASDNESFSTSKGKLEKIVECK